MKKLFILLILFGPSFMHAQSLEEILAAPYCSDLVSSDAGEVISWVSNNRGVRTIYTASAPDWIPKKQYSSEVDDGQILRNFQFSKSQNYLYFVCGSAPNRSGELANPTSSTAYPEPILLRIALSTSVIDTIGSYTNYLVGSSETNILLVQGNTLQQFEIASEKIIPLVKMRGSFSAVQMAPNGESLCFVSARGDHSFIGHYIFGQSQIDWIAPSVYRDILPVWSPMGDQIAFIRTPGQRKGELFNLTGGQPFSIVLYNLHTHSAKTLWQSPADDGGFAQYYPSEPLRWSKSGHLLFYSEHEGWMKIYALNPETQTVKALQDGSCEIEHSHLSPDGNQIVFSSNCGDIDRRNIFIYDLSQDKLQQISSGDDIETDPHLLGPGHIIYRHASDRKPTSICRYQNNETTQLFPNPEAKFEEFVTPHQVIFAAADDTPIHGQLFVKDTIEQQPAVIFMHGGPIRQMLLGYHYSSYYANAYAFNQFLAAQGYIVLSVNYRDGIGYGRDFRRAENQGPRGASEYQDIVAAGRFLQELDFVDSERIGLWGGSYGGYLTAMGLARDSDLFKAGVDLHGVHDWSWRATDFSPGGAWGIDEELMDEALASSPVADVTSWRSPVLLIHGDDDRNVMFGQTIDLVERLKEQDTPHEILVFPDEVHGFYRFQTWLETFQASFDFFERHLKP